MERRKVAIFGASELGIEVARNLDPRQHPFVLADPDPDKLAWARDRGVEGMLVDHTDDAALQELGIGRDVGLLFCLFQEDADNVFLTISARAIDPELRIVSVVDSRDSIPKLLAAGANKLIDPYEIGGNRISRIMRSPALVDVLDQYVYSNRRLQLAEIPVPEGSKYLGLNYCQLRLNERFGLIVIGILDPESGKELLFSRGGFTHRLRAGDALVVIGPAPAIAAFRESLEGRPEADARPDPPPTTADPDASPPVPDNRIGVSRRPPRT